MMRYQDTDLSIPQIASELGVSYVLEGSVQKYGDNVRINVQLIDGPSDLHLWSNNYDRSLKDIFEIQSEVALQISEKLKVEISPKTEKRIKKYTTKSQKAYDLYLRVLAAFGTGYSGANQEDSFIPMLKEIIEIDSTFANAYAMLGGQSLFKAGVSGIKNPLEVSQKGKEYLLKALKLDPLNAQAYSGLADYYLWMEWDLETALVNKLTSIELEPSNVLLQVSVIDVLLASGKFSEAIKRSESILKAEPTFTGQWPYLAIAQALNGEPREKVLKNSLKSLVRDYTLGDVTEAARANLMAGNYQQVIRILNDYPVKDTIPRNLGHLAIAKYKTGDKTDFKNLLHSLIERSKNTAGGSPSLYLAMVYASMNEVEEAFKWLDKAYRDHEIEMYWLKVEPEFKTLYNDPRWQEMLDKVGFPD